jgi:Uma2 family endonuclease
MNVEDYLQFLETRPDEERWQLIDGVAVMMAPPSRAHQRIVHNFQVLLNNHFRTTNNQLFADHESGVRVAGLDNFLPQPDIIAAPGLAGEEIYTTDFRLVAEVLSPSNTQQLIAQKLRHYRASPLCLHVVTVDSRRIWAEVHSRGEEWSSEVITDSGAHTVLPAFGFSCPLGDLYKNTILDPALPKS